MINKNIAFAFLALATGLATAGHVHAGQGTVMLGTTGFADRCHYNGGQLFDTEDGYACQLQTTLVECTFGGAYADCEWNGVQTKIEVVRLIGMVEAQSIATGGGSGAVKKAGGGGGGGIQQPNLPIKNN